MVVIGSLDIYNQGSTGRDSEEDQEKNQETFSVQCTKNKGLA